MTSFICLHVMQMHLLKQVSYGSREQRSQDLHSQVADQRPAEDQRRLAETEATADLSDTVREITDT